MSNPFLSPHEWVVYTLQSRISKMMLVDNFPWDVYFNAEWPRKALDAVKAELSLAGWDVVEKVDRTTVPSGWWTIKPKEASIPGPQG